MARLLTPSICIILYNRVPPAVDLALRPDSDRRYLRLRRSRYRSCAASHGLNLNLAKSLADTDNQLGPCVSRISFSSPPAL